MRSLIVFLTVVLLSNVFYGQNAKELDSLFGVWKSEEFNPDERTAAFNNYIEKKYLYSAPDSVPHFSRRMIEFSKKKNFFLRKILFYLWKLTRNSNFKFQTKKFL